MPNRRRHDAAALERGPFAGCWEWTGSTNGNGYGLWEEHGSRAYVHRAVFEALVRPLKSGEIVRHSCDNPRCFNVAHLLAGSLKDNAQDMARRGRQHLQVLRAADVLLIRAYYRGGATQRALAAHFGVAQTSIWSIIAGRSWSHVPDDGTALAWSGEQRQRRRQCSRATVDARQQAASPGGLLPACR